MYQRKFIFYKHTQENVISVSKDNLFSDTLGFGFLTERNREEDELLQVPEVNNGFKLPDKEKIDVKTNICQDELGCFLQEADIPLSFKASIPHNGNYRVSLKVRTGAQGVDHLLVLAQCRRLMAYGKKLEANQTYEYNFNVNVCSIIPDHNKVPHNNTGVTISLLGGNVRITELSIEEVDLPTIFIAGDSTVTDQLGNYPYLPSENYCGWGQMLTVYANDKIALSNHAHSGLTTETFISEGHYQIVMDHIKPGDFYFMQFGHNDQKVATLDAKGGYANNIKKFINEIREKGATPVIVTSIARNTWEKNEEKILDMLSDNAKEGVQRDDKSKYRDLLHEYAQECINIGHEEKVPVIDLHGRSMEFIKSLGMEPAKVYFYPNDYTHTNDFGGFKMATYVWDECKKVDILANLFKDEGQEFPIEMA